MMTQSQSGRTIQRRAGANVGLIGVVLLLLAGAGAAVWYFFIHEAEPETKPLPKDLQLVSADSAAFVCIRLGDLWTSEGMQERFRKQMQMSDKEFNKIKEWEDKLGTGLADIERVTLVMPDTEQFDKTKPEIWFIIQAKNAYDRDKIQSALELKEQEHNGKKYGEFDNNAVHFVDDKIAVFGPPAGVKAFLDQEVKTEGSLKQPLQRAGEDHLMVLGFAMAEKVKNDAAKAASEETKPFLSILEMSTVTLIADAKEKGFKLEVVADYADDDKAKTAKSALEGVISFGKRMLKEKPERNPIARQAQDSMGELLSAAKVEQDGKALRVTAEASDTSLLWMPITFWGTSTSDTFEQVDPEIKVIKEPIDKPTPKPEK